MLASLKRISAFGEYQLTVSEEETNQKYLSYLNEVYKQIFQENEYFLQEGYQDLTLETEEDEILIPKSFHKVLVDGASYYLMLDEGGVVPKPLQVESLKRFEKGKLNLQGYLFNKASSSGSSFERV